MNTENIEVRIITKGLTRLVTVTCDGKVVAAEVENFEYLSAEARGVIHAVESLCSAQKEGE